MRYNIARDQYSQKRALATKAGQLIDEAVTHIRNRGLTRERAILEIADCMGMNPHRAKKLAYSDAEVIEPEEYRAILFRFREHLDSEAESLVSRLAGVKRRRRQLESQHGSTWFGMGVAETRGSSDRDHRGEHVGS